MATALVLLIDDESRMKDLLRGPVGLPAELLVHDPSGIFEPEPGRHGLVLLNAEYQKSFGLCRRFKKKRETADVPIAFFTFSHEREHLRILAEHRALPTHADHYLLPPLKPERLLDLLGRTIGPFEACPPVEPPPAPEGDVLEPDVDDPEDLGFEQEGVHEPTREDALTPPPTPVHDGNDEFAEPPPGDAFDDEGPLSPPPPPEGLLEPLAGEPSLGGAEPSLGGFQADRFSSVERYVSGLHDELAKREDRLEARKLELERREAELQAESAAAVLDAQRKAAALADEADRLRAELQAALSARSDPAELEHAQAEVATVRGELEWARTEAEQSHAEISRLRAEADRLLAESDRLRGEGERLRREGDQLRTALAAAEERAALTAQLEARVDRAARRLTTLGQSLLAARPALLALLELSRDLELERQVDADGVPPGFDDR